MNKRVTLTLMALLSLNLLYTNCTDYSGESMSSELVSLGNEDVGKELEVSKEKEAKEVQQKTAVAKPKLEVKKESEEKAKIEMEEEKTPLRVNTIFPEELNFMRSFRNNYALYETKKDLKPIGLRNGKKLYIVNQGSPGNTSVPNGVNGKNAHLMIASSQWRLGMKKGEVYAIRYRTKSSYSSGRFRMKHTKSVNGVVSGATYSYNISNLPGEINESSFKGRCRGIFSRGSIDITPPGREPFVSEGSYCEVPEGSMFYLNVELAPKSYKECSKGLCSGFISAYNDAFKYPDFFSSDAYAERVEYLKQGGL